VPGEVIHVGVDIGGGQRSHTAVVWLNKPLHVGCAVFESEDGILYANEQVLQLAEKYTIAEISFDPWRAGALARGWETRGLKTTVFPFSDSRAVPAAAELYDAIVEQKLTQDGDETLARHMSLVVGKATRRGIRIDKAKESDQIDACSALLMAYESATQPPPPAGGILGVL
jgi:phage terminase large subunit-like protein